MGTENRRLLVIVPDSLSELIDKGELQPRYYNPGDFFDEVRLMTTSTDSGTVDAIQPAVGRANLSLESYPADLEIVQDWLQPRRNYRLRKWAQIGVERIKEFSPHLIRCHGADWNTFLAAQAKNELGIPYAVSLHINADENPTRRFQGQNLTRDQRRLNRFYEHVESTGLRRADIVMPVYQPIVPYLLRRQVQRWEVHYNVLDGDSLAPKTTYEISRPVRLMCVTRLILEKTPVPILEAISGLPETELTLVGDGVNSAEVEAAIDSLGIGDRVTWFRALPNNKVCEMLHEHDLFVIYSQYWELSKSLIEALLTGLPTIVNRRIGDPVPELSQGDFIYLCDGTSTSYREAIQRLVANGAERQRLGERAFQWARQHVHPSITEAKYVETYMRLLQSTSGEQTAGGM